MAVKKHKLGADNRNQLDLTALAQYFQIINAQEKYLTPTLDLVKHCQDIVKCLARTPGTVDQLWQLLQPVEDFLLRIMTSIPCNFRHEIFTAIIDKFYSYISDPQFEACPALATVLIVIDQNDEESTLSTARWLVQRTQNGPAEPVMRRALSCLYRWLHDWQSTPALGFWIIAYIKALEESEHYDVLIETSIDNLATLFSCLAKPRPIHQNMANVIFHILASLRESVEAFDRISSNVAQVLVKLASDSGQWSRQILQDLVDILTAMVDRITSSLKSDALEMFRNKYACVIACLERHIASRASSFLQQCVWRTPIAFLAGINTRQPPVQKVGLLNLGNSCYMNSVVQALLVTRMFSRHVILRTLTSPYWEKMGELFAHMMYSASANLNPDKYFRCLKPPFFTSNHQHDSSEFLSYLLELLHCYEHIKDSNYDYTQPPVLNGANRSRLMHAHVHQPTISSDENESDQSRGRSVSPRPGSSGGSGSSRGKRSSSDEGDVVSHHRKRARMTIEVRRDSVIDRMFGGVLLTRIQCTMCQSSSSSRDDFRDLQLAFPEKEEDRQHSVQGLLEYYCSKESMTGNNQYHCHDCGGLRDAEKSVIIETTPKCLILVLKNFKFDAKQLVQSKLMQSVTYNHTITLPTLRAQAVHPTYNLFAAVIHAGNTLDLGHYYTLAKDNGQWHNYNDCTVTYTDESQLDKLQLSSTPYILFYRRTDVDEVAAPTFEELPRYLQDEISTNNKMYMEREMRLARP